MLPKANSNGGITGKTTQGRSRLWRIIWGRIWVIVLMIRKEKQGFFIMKMHVNRAHC
jgi:hypothetical protein